MSPYGPTPMPASAPASFTAAPTNPGGSPSRGGIVFVIIGLSAVIAVLLILLLWALL
jgi:hypothetical protein